MRFGVLSRTDYDLGGWESSGPTRLARCHAELIREATSAEKSAFSFFGISEHHRTSGGYWSSPMLTTAFVGCATKSIQVGPLALLLPLYNPIRVAEDSAYLYTVLKSRLRLCVAAGYSPSDMSLFGVDKGSLGQVFTTALRTLHQCWGSSKGKTGDSAKFASVTPKPSSPLRVFIGSWSRRGLRRALKLVDGWVCSTFVPMIDIEPMFSYVQTRSKAKGKKIVTACIREAWVDRNKKRALQIACKYHASVHRRLLQSGNYPWKFPRIRIEDYVSTNMIVGDVDECVDQVRRLRSIGFDEVICRFRQSAGPNVSQAIESAKLFGTDVIPSFS